MGVRFSFVSDLIGGGDNNGSPAKTLSLDRILHRTGIILKNAILRKF